MTTDDTGNTRTTADEPQAVAAGKDTGGVATQAMPSKERAKFYIAIGYVFSFLFIIGGMPYVVLILGKINVGEFKDIVLTLGGVLGGPFGIVINNFFKEDQDR